MQVQVQSFAGGDAAAPESNIELDDEVFGVDPRVDILHRVVTWQLEKRRGTARGTRERADVARTGKKFGRQKGGGTARHGDRKAPVFVGGGKAHGAQVRDFNPSLNKKVRALGLKMALSSHAQAGSLIVMDTLGVAGGKTKALSGDLARLGFGKRSLVIDGDAVETSFALAAGNLAQVDVLPAMGANVYDILRADTLVLTRAAVEKLEARFHG